jgi:diamine N-acetyltransferase
MDEAMTNMAYNSIVVKLAKERGVAVMSDAPAGIHLKEITAETVRQICALSTKLAPAQRRMVADNAVSIAEAYFCEKAWFRAIYAGDEPVGFVMLHLGGDAEEEGEYDGVFLWRFMIAGPHQGKGYGKKAVERIKEHLRGQGIRELMTSYMDTEGGAAGFYQSMGFVPTGKMHGGEAETFLKF